MTIRTITSPDGETLVAMTPQEYQDLVDARDHATAMRQVAADIMPTLTDAEVDAYLAAPTPLAFWRQHRGLTQAELATAAKVSQPYIAQLESHKRKSADIMIYSRIAKRLRVRIEDLIAE